MKCKMLINARHAEECRVALLENGVLQELEIEYAGREETKGNVYKGVIVRVEPSMQACFVDYGGNRHGFIPYSEIQSTYGGGGEDKEAGGRERLRPERDLKPGKELLVQIVKEERDTKGAYLSTYISLAGRYLVLMPGSRKGGVSRKIEDEGERSKLKDIIAGLDVPEDMALIIRTAGMGRTKSDLKRDLTALQRVWGNITRMEKTKKAPALIYREGDLVIRSIRDYFSTDVGEILTDNPEIYKKARDFMKVIMPRYQSRVRLSQGKSPLFVEHNLENQIEAIYSNRVSLKSGGSIVIDPTEALVSIDVNSGRSRGEKNIEDTAFKTNMEAAAEIARQLRLRDLGGLIVIDFIDMRPKSNIQQVEKTLKGDLKRDKARIDVGRISKFGLLEMSRQRIRSSLIERGFVACPHCGGSGYIKSEKSNAVFLLRKIHEAALDPTVEKVDLLLPVEVANDMHNRKRADIAKIEKDHAVLVVITGQAGVPVNSYSIEVTRKKQPKFTQPEKHKTEDKPKLERGDTQGRQRRRGGGKKPSGDRHSRDASSRDVPPAEGGNVNEATGGQEKEEDASGLLSRIRKSLKKKIVS